MLVAHEVQHVAMEEPLRSDLKRREADGTETALTNMRTYLRLYGLARRTSGRFASRSTSPARK
jgi:hypothetical protein